MGIGRRIAQIFRSRRHGTEDVDALAERLDETYRAQLSHLQKVRRGVADVATSRKRVEVQLAKLAQEGATLEAEAQAAVGRGDDAAARAVLTRKVALEQAADDLRERHDTLLADEQRITSTAEDLERKIEDFRRRKDTLTARHSAAAARAEITGASGGIASSMSDVNQAMESAERHTRELEAKADAVDELVRDGIIGAPGESADDAEQRRFDAELNGPGSNSPGSTGLGSKGLGSTGLGSTGLGSTGLGPDGLPPEGGDDGPHQISR